jgi:hypothetical protein
MIPQWYRRALLAPQGDKGKISLLEISHPDWSAEETIRLSSHAEQIFSYDPLRRGTLHLGVEYRHGIVTGEKPDDIEGEFPNASAVIANEGLQYSHLLDSSAEGCVVRLLHVARAAPDVILEEFPEFVLNGVEASGLRLALDFILDPIEAEEIPFERYTPETCPGLFR